MCVSVCFARNNDEMFERDSIWSDTDKIFKERDRRDHLTLLLVLRFSSTFSKRERPRALWMRSLFYLRFPRLLTRRSEEISATRDSTRLVECTRVTLFRLFCETGPKRRRGVGRFGPTFPFLNTREWALYGVRVRSPSIFGGRRCGFSRPSTRRRGVCGRRGRRERRRLGWIRPGSDTDLSWSLFLERKFLRRHLLRQTEVKSSRSQT